jgi:hypothetical protein
LFLTYLLHIFAKKNMGKTVLSQNNIIEIINLYQTNIPSTHKLAEHFNVGHKKITQILKENNISINKLGGQKKDGLSKIVGDNKTLRYLTIQITYLDH